jgi:DNA-binding NtrC family response regulator
MKKPPGGEGNPTYINVLSVSPFEEDHAFLRTGFSNQAAWTHSEVSPGTLHIRHTIAAAQMVLRQKRIAVVLCESDSIPGAYRTMLEHLMLVPQPPPLIVTSGVADEKLWSEVLALGAYDLLAKPFHLNEVVWSIRSALLHCFRDHAKAQFSELMAGVETPLSSRLR